MKYPIGIQTFEKIVEGGYVYVDKTELVYQLTQENSIYFLSRPRRFGKSLLLSTLKSYYQGKKELFKGLGIEKLEKEWKRYPIFHIDFNGGNFKNPGELEKKLNFYVSTWEQEYETSSFKEELSIGDRFYEILRRAHEQTGQRAVVLVDEYDKPLLDVLDTKTELEEEHRNILKGFFSTFKAADEHLQFVFLTGVTKFSQISVFSGFNQPKDISMNTDYESLCGITQEELEKYFEEPIIRMAKKYEYTKEEMLGRLKEEYDGYHFGEEMIDIYNPFSILNAFDRRSIEPYWSRTGNPEYLLRLLAHSQEKITDYVGKYYPLQEFIDYKADAERPLPMIYQSGYLTIKGWDRETNSFLLDYPNGEVRKSFLSEVAASYFVRTEGESIGSWIVKMQRSLNKGEIEETGKFLKSFLAGIPYCLHERSKEKDFQYTLYLIFKLLNGEIVEAEKEQSQGRVDCIVETRNYIYIFEFKLDGSAEEALEQIEERGYAKEYGADKRKLYRIGANFSSKTGTIEEWKVV